jgi:catechol 2,3-dioxygenase-like lactoylglutathione lyase family enzyme
MDIDLLVSQYERGVISRRNLLAALGALVAAAPSARAADAPVGPVKQLNHVTIFVPDVSKSAEFYQTLFAMPVLTPQDPGINLDAGSGFLGIYPASSAAKGINHLCLGIENFDADTVLATLKGRGVTARIRRRGDTKELYLNDPDGISVQLQDTKYIGGVGPLGDKKP